MNKLFFWAVLFVLSYQPVLAANNSSLNSIEGLAGNKPQLSLHAKGDQIYVCALDAGDYAWKWQAPEAKLYDAQEQVVVGDHGAGPSWTYKDGSSVKAKMTQKIDSPDKAAIPWLLLEVTEHHGNGVLSKAGYILRINTEGGAPPSEGCDDNHLGAEKRVSYSADYNFYGQ